MNTSVNELLSNPAFRPLVLLDVLAVFLMIICLVFRRMRKGYYVEQANDARKATMLNIAVRNVTGMGGLFGTRLLGQRGSEPMQVRTRLL